MTDALLAHLTTPAPAAARESLRPIPWPSGTAPVVRAPVGDASSALPKVDVVVSVYTSAEGQATADVLSPGLELDRWTPYTRDFARYEPTLTDDSPARDERCLGQYALVTIGMKLVLLWRNALHLATDSKALPIRRCWAQIIEEARPSLWIDSGTAGGIGPQVVEGDTVAANHLVFDCTGFLADEPYAHQSFACSYDLSAFDWTVAESLMAANAQALRPEATRDPKVWSADVITCDSFLFDAVGDPFGLETYDNAAALVEEMDAATLGLVAQDLGSAMPPYTSLRSVSDPQMPDLGNVEKEKALAEKVYDDYGYAAQVATLCAVQQVIAGL